MGEVIEMSLFESRKYVEPETLAFEDVEADVAACLDGIFVSDPDSQEEAKSIARLYSTVVSVVIDLDRPIDPSRVLDSDHRDLVVDLGGFDYGDLDVETSSAFEDYNSKQVVSIFGKFQELWVSIGQELGADVDYESKQRLQKQRSVLSRQVFDAVYKQLSVKTTHPISASNLVTHAEYRADFFLARAHSEGGLTRFWSWNKEDFSLQENVVQLHSGQQRLDIPGNTSPALSKNTFEAVVDASIRTGLDNRTIELSPRDVERPCQDEIDYNNIEGEQLVELAHVGARVWVKHWLDARVVELADVVGTDFDSANNDHVELALTYATGLGSKDLDLEICRRVADSFLRIIDSNEESAAVYEDGELSKDYSAAPVLEDGEILTDAHIDAIVAAANNAGRAVVEWLTLNEAMRRHPANWRQQRLAIV